jgi:ADP-heptose:LPS heptosyltransferase
MEKILIIRFSALGDVAMTVPAVHALATQYPALQVTVLSRPHMAALFEDMPQNVRFVGADLKGEYAGFGGLNRLARRLMRERFDYVADFHDVLRSQYLRLALRLSGARVARIDKGRKGKRQLVRAERKVMRQQTSSFARYAGVLDRLGLPIRSDFRKLFPVEAPLPEAMREPTAVSRIGIAPFAAHAGKIYPLEKMEKVIGLLTQREDVRIYLFGGGKREEDTFALWESRFPHVKAMTRLGGMHRELEAMSHLDVMLCMDSGNMHLAALTGIPVVAIWGATHPFAGFMAWQQGEPNTLQLDLPCRPCSVFGNKPCLRGDFACMQGISPESVVERIDHVINMTNHSTEKER